MLVHVQRACCFYQQMDIHKLTSNAQARGEQAASKAPTQPQWQPQTLSRTMDVHAASKVVVRAKDGMEPKPPRTFKPADSLAWVRWRILCCVRNNLPRGQPFHPQTSFRYPLVRRQGCHPEPALHFRVPPCGAVRNRDFVPQVGLICALTTLNPTESLQ
jgi:hypothetical protein